MATLKMAAPWRDSQTGFWYLRRRVPTHLAAVAGGSGIVKWSLGTKDDREAKARWPDTLKRWAAQVAEWERLSRVVSLAPAQAAEVAAKWASWIAAGNGSVIGNGYASDIFEPITLPETRTPAAMVRMMECVERHAEEALIVAGIAITPESRPVLLNALLPAVSAAYLQADAAALGICGTAPALNPFAAVRAFLPKVPDVPARGRKGLSLDELFKAYAAVATVKPSSLAETQYAIAALAKAVGHDDAAKVTKGELIAWRGAMKAEGRTNNTWNNRLSLIDQVFARAVADGKLPANPADGLRLPKSKPASRLPFSDDDARKILAMSRQESRPSLRWAHWIMAFTGMRVGEVLQLDASDIRQEGGIWYLHLEGDTAGKSIKNSTRRNVPLHPALVSEGLTDYAQSLPPGSPLFPDKRPDKHGNRGGKGWQVAGRWVRETVGITDPRKVPDHSWRHRFEDELRAADVPEYLRDAILGHARKTVGRQYGVRGEALAGLYAAIRKLAPPPGL